MVWKIQFIRHCSMINLINYDDAYKQSRKYFLVFRRDEKICSN